MNCELLAPAGSFNTAIAAFAAGADAVYCGLTDFSARKFASNFSLDELRALMRVARAQNRKVYVAFNTLLNEDELDAAIPTLAELDEMAPDALIVQDLGVARLCREHFPHLPLHASTQLVAHNLEGVLALGERGFSRVVLARELSLDEIAYIAKRCGTIELECFIHGALCYSLSGLCLFSAMEKGRSGNRGLCAYCCRLPQVEAEGKKCYPFSMKDMRLGEDARKLAELGVASLKIEGRMKNELYVASVTRYYREILDAKPVAERTVTTADLETIFSRRTTELRLTPTSAAASPIDATSLGHLGTPIGIVKRITRDREGRPWLRFHTNRALEKHDGLQFATLEAGKPIGLGISELRSAFSRTPVFEVPAGSDVEVLLPEREDGESPDFSFLRPGDMVYCSMSNAVKRQFPAPSVRMSNYSGLMEIEVEVTFAPDCVMAIGKWRDIAAKVSMSGDFPLAQHPEKSYAALTAALGKSAEKTYNPVSVKLDDPSHVFVPASKLNDLRRDLYAQLDNLREAARQKKIDEVRFANPSESFQNIAEDISFEQSGKSIKLRLEQPLPTGDWAEVVYAIDADSAKQVEILNLPRETTRLALPVFVEEQHFPKLRVAVKHLLREGYTKWEAADLAGVRLLKACGVTDISGDWSLYAFNAWALSELKALGVAKFVASPENTRENNQYLAESGFPVAFLAQQSTPLFISLHKPAAIPTAESGLAVFSRQGLWITTRRTPRTFHPPTGSVTRIDLSWDPPL